MNGGVKLVLMLAAIAAVCCLQCGCPRIGQRRTADRTIRLKMSIRQFAVTPDGRRLAARGDSANPLSMVDLQDSSIEPIPIGPLHPSINNLPLTKRGVASAIAFSQDGMRLAAAVLKPSMLENPPVPALAWKEGVDIWDVGAKSLVERIDLEDSASGRNVSAIRYSPDGRYVYLGTKVVRRLDLQSKQATVIFRAGATKLVQPEEERVADVSDLDVSPDGKTLAIALAHGVVLFDLASQSERLGLKTERRGVVAVEFSPDGKVLATAADRVQLWDVKRGVNLASFEDLFKSGYGYVSSIAFSPDQKILAAGLAVGTHDSSYVAVWRLADRRHMITFACHTEPVSDVAFVPGGHTLITGGFDKTLQFWDLKEFAALPAGAARADSGKAATDKTEKSERE